MCISWCVCIYIPAKRQNKSANQYKEKQEGDIDGEIREGMKKKIIRRKNLILLRNLGSKIIEKNVLPLVSPNSIDIICTTTYLKYQNLSGTVQSSLKVLLTCQCFSNNLYFFCLLITLLD